MRYNPARAGYAQSYLLVTILAAVQRGVDPFSGSGRILGPVRGLFVLQVVARGCSLFGFNQQLTLAIGGATLIAVLAVGAWRERRARRRSRRRG